MGMTTRVNVMDSLQGLIRELEAVQKTLEDFSATSVQDASVMSIRKQLNAVKTVETYAKRTKDLMEQYYQDQIGLGS
jgi:hypothetical protein